MPKVLKVPKRNPLVAAVLKKGVCKHKNKKRAAIIEGQRKDNYE